MTPRPSPLGVWVCVGAVPVAALPALFGDRFVAAWVAYVALAALAFGLDLVLGLSRGRLTVTTSCPAAAYLGDATGLEVVLSAAGLAGATVEVVADLDEDLSPQPPRRARVPAGGATRLEVPLVPRRRGRHRVRALWLRWDGPLGLVRRGVRVPVDRVVAVMPDVRPVQRAALRYFTSREHLTGSKPERHLGDGSEFESLREHVAGLDPRRIDWKASARHRRLLSQETRAERDHRLVLAFDTGRLMREPLGDLPRLDHAIHAGLLLAYVALRTGDRVGVHAFDARPRAWLAPAAGVETFGRVQAALAGLEYATEETNFTLGLLDLLTKLRRRSLVVVLTDFTDVVTAQLMVENVARLVRRHLVLFVTLRDPDLEAVAAARPRSLGDLYRAVTAADFLRDREGVLRRLGRLGVRVVDARPQDVGPRVLDRYLEIHRRELVG